MGIYNVQGDELVIALKTDKERPGVFSTDRSAPAAANLVYTFKRKGPPPTRAIPPKTPKLTPEDNERALVKGYADLQGVWIRESIELNGHGPYWAANFEALRIEKNTMRQVRMSSNPGFSDENFPIIIHPNRNPMAIDFKMRNDVFEAIYKIEGDRLFIAVREEATGDRPFVFSTRLEHGSQRAHLIITYRRAGSGGLDPLLASLQGHWIRIKRD